MEKIVDPEKLIRGLCELDSEETWFEFKTNLSDPEKIGEYVSALANSAMLEDKQDAFMVFGIVDATHEIVGTSTRLKTQKVKGELLASWLTRYLDPKVHFSFHGCQISGKRVEFVCIKPTYEKPVKFKNVAYIRIESANKRLDDYQEIERSLWLLTSRYSFEAGVAESNVSEQEIFERFGCKTLAKLFYGKALSNEAIITDFLSRGLIRDNLQGGFDVTNLFALVAAKNMNEFKSLENKAPRLIVYKDRSKEFALDDVQGQLGYAVGFERLLRYVMSKIEGDEVFLHGVRTKTHKHPEISVREFLANALIHQDLTAVGHGPRIEIFSDKMVITNPGKPLIETDLFINAPAKSRNEKLARLLRDAHLCEERGSGVDRACAAIEKEIQAPPLFRDVEDSTIVTLFRSASFARMTKEDRVRACYQHACLKYIMGDPLTNSSLRLRLGLNANQSASATSVINDTIETGLIKPVDTEQGKKNSRYFPAWV